MFAYMTGDATNVKFTEAQLKTAYNNIDKFQKGSQKTEWKRVYNDPNRVGIKKKEPVKKVPVKKEPVKKKLAFLNELQQTDKSILEDAGNYNLQNGKRCSHLVDVSRYIIKAEKDKFKKVRIFSNKDIDTDINRVGSWELNNPSPLAILYNYFYQLIENKDYLIRIKKECGVRELLFVEKAYKILLDDYDLIQKKIIEQNKRYNPTISKIIKDRKLKDIEFNLTTKKEPVKKTPEFF